MPGVGGPLGAGASSKPGVDSDGVVTAGENGMMLSALMACSAAESSLSGSESNGEIV